MGIPRRLAVALAGEPVRIPSAFLARHREFALVRLRRGGLPPRVGGWLLGERSVAAITLWHTIWLGRTQPVSGELLLHEFCHVQQFEADRAFPLRYLWECFRRGYGLNRFEVAARHFAQVNAPAFQVDPPFEET